MEPYVGCYGEEEFCSSIVPNFQPDSFTAIITTPESRVQRQFQFEIAL
jgi:hypothetical protein